VTRAHEVTMQVSKLVRAPRSLAHALSANRSVAHSFVARLSLIWHVAVN
jgi:hypothetical protein